MKKSLKLSLIGAAIAGLLVGGVAAPANAYWYNTAIVQSNSQTITVRNTDGAQFGVAAGNSAWNINRAYASPGTCLRVQNAQNGGTTTYNANGGRWITIGAYPGGAVNLRKYTC